jgi:hypothetical protein
MPNLLQTYEYTDFLGRYYSYIYLITLLNVYHLDQSLKLVRLNTLYFYNNSLFCRKELLCVKNGIRGWDNGSEISKAICGGVIGPNPL